MIELETGKYTQVLPLLDLIEINTLFARAVLEHTITGKVYTDDPDDPRAYYIAHPYGMSLVLGDTGNEAFVCAVCEYITNSKGGRRTAEWLQADPAGEWTGIIDAAAASHNSAIGLDGGFRAEASSRAIQRNTRVNFILDRTAFAAAKRAARRQPAPVVRLAEVHFTALEQGVVPRFFWRDAEHFTAEGAGFVVLTAEGDVAAAAFSSCCAGGQLEIGIETLQAHRGKGYAFAVSLALIEYCLEHGLEPVWACRQENTGSYRLAQKLGFRPVLTLPYFGLAYEA
ncbi:GNAT family N-acetyltransferase [Paenibacillus typhae]|uniref:GNAT family N-acetyltransferase n=1 Tax=Paenibacillus typhae TaxID=1174501 RepID=UPI001C8D8A5A|nr:GNAT family N-acetyltransferase [Paenibacillus typhae]MBY0010699.1 GNAT family N-acetyltransferase [Paenibacillus typhae]